MGYDHTPEQLIASLRGEQYAIFVGSGPSKVLGVPDWEELLRKLAKKIDYSVEPLFAKGERFHRIGSAVKKAYLEQSRGQDYLDFLAHNMEQTLSKYCSQQVAILKASRGVVITTNFDCCLEAVWQNAEDFEYLKHRIWNVPELDETRVLQEETLVHLHGNKDEKRFILTTEDYEQWYPNALQDERKPSSRLEDFLKSLFTRMPFFFVGFSFEDDHLLRSLKKFRALNKTNIEVDLKFTGGQLVLQEPRHWALLPKEEKEEQEKEEAERRDKENSLHNAGIHIVWYEEPYVRLETVLSELALPRSASQAGGTTSV